MRKPFFKKSHQCWYVKDKNGREIRLDPAEERAFKLWERMRSSELKITDPDVRMPKVVSVFLNEYEHTVTPARYKLVEHYATEFSARFQGTKLHAIKAADVSKWVREKKGWGGWAKHDAIASAKMVMKWAHDSGYIDKNPLAKLKNSTPAPRVRVISNAEHSKLVLAARESNGGGHFAAYLIASRCGARPAEIRSVCASDVNGDVWILQDHKTRNKTNAPLVIYLPPCLQTLTKILLHRNDGGRLFRQSDGTPWTKDSVCRKMKTIRDKAGVSKVVCYHYRHTLATNSLLGGASLAETAQLLGHRDTRMVSQVYGHLDQNRQHMINAAAKAASSQISGK